MTLFCTTGCIPIPRDFLVFTVSIIPTGYNYNTPSSEDDMFAAEPKHRLWCTQLTRSGPYDILPLSNTIIFFFCFFNRVAPVVVRPYSGFSVSSVTFTAPPTRYTYWSSSVAYHGGRSGVLPPSPPLQIDNKIQNGQVIYLVIKSLKCIFRVYLIHVARKHLIYRIKMCTFLNPVLTRTLSWNRKWEDFAIVTRVSQVTCKLVDTALLCRCIHYKNVKTRENNHAFELEL